MLRAMNVSLDEEALADALVKAIPDINLLELAKPKALRFSTPLLRPHSDLVRRHTTMPIRYRPKRPQSFAEPRAAGHVASPYSSPSRSAEIRQVHGSRMSYPGLSGTHEWVERRLSRLMSDEFLQPR